MGIPVPVLNKSGVGPDNPNFLDIRFLMRKRIVVIFDMCVFYYEERKRIKGNVSNKNALSYHFCFKSSSIYPIPGFKSSPIYPIPGFKSSPIYLIPGFKSSPIYPIPGFKSSPIYPIPYLVPRVALYSISNTRFQE